MTDIETWRSERDDLTRANASLHAEIERLRALKTSASSQLLNITKAALDHAEAEVKQMSAIVEIERQRNERLRNERLAFATESEERRAEIERLQAVIANGRRRDLQVADGIIRDLQAEIERLRADKASMQTALDKITDEADKWRAEIERLRFTVLPELTEEIERLRAERKVCPDCGKRTYWEDDMEGHCSTCDDAEIERLRAAVTGWLDEIERLQAEVGRLRAALTEEAYMSNSLRREIERLQSELVAANIRAGKYSAGCEQCEPLRALLLTVACPGGGWTGQPKEIEEATVADCLAAGVCGCVYGAGLSDAK